jgi:hypothetical protein
VLNSSGLYTVRSYKQTLLIFLSALLGSVFGIMGALAGILRITEKTFLKTKFYVKGKTQLEKIKIDRGRLKTIMSVEEDGELQSVKTLD